MFLRSVWRALQRRWRLAGGLAAGALLAGLVVVPGSPVTYEARARLVMRDGGAPELALGDEVLASVPPAMRSSVAASRPAGSNVVTLSAVASRPSRAVEAVNAAGRAFESLSAARHRETTARTLAGLEAAIRQRLAEEQALEAPGPAVAPGADPTERLYAARLQELERARLAAKLELDELALRIDQLNRRVERGESGPAAPVDTTGSDRLAAELEAARRDLDELRTIYPSDWPPVARAASRVEDLRLRHAAAVNREILEARFAPTRKLLDQLRADSARRDELTRGSADLDARIEDLRKRLGRAAPPRDAAPDPARSDEARRAAVAASRQDLERRRAALLAERDLPSGPVERFEPASSAAVVRAPVFWILGAALLLGLLGAWTAESLATTLRTDYDVRRVVNLPLLGIVPLSRSPEERSLVRAAARSPIVEVFNTAAALIESHARQASARLYAVTSAVPGEGKSTVTCNLAVALARAGSRVLLVDADLRKATQHQLLNVANDPGLSSYLIGATDEIDTVIFPTEVENLSLLPSGPLLQSPAPYLRSERFRALLPELRERFDFLFVDLPPVRSAADGLHVVGLADAVLLVLAAGETRKDDATAAKRLVRGAQGKLAGCILNKAEIQTRGYYYYSAAPAVEAGAAE